MLLRVCLSLACSVVGVGSWLVPVSSSLAAGEGVGMAAASSASAPPSTRREPVMDEFHGVKVADDFRWLESGSNPEVKAWSEAQNAYTRGVLDALPAAPGIRARLKQLEEQSTADYRTLEWVGGKLFAIKDQPPKQQPMLVVLSSAASTADERVIIDPNALDASGGTSIDWFVPSRDGSLVAASISEGGSESGTVYVFRTETGEKLSDRVPRVNGGTAGGSLAWTHDNSGFFYTRYPREGERSDADLAFYHQVYFHALGTDTAQDRYEVGKEFPKIAEIELQSSRDGQWILATVENGDGGEFMHWIRNPEGMWRQVLGYQDRVKLARFGPDDLLFVLSYANSLMGEVYRMRLGRIELERGGLIFVGSNERAIVDFAVTDQHVFALDQLGGISGLRAMDFTGSNPVEFKLFPNSAITSIVGTDSDGVLVRQTSFLQAPAWYSVSVENPGLVRTALYTESPARFNDCEVARVTAQSKDGTPVPMTILRKRGTKLDGGNPTILYGYGGYGVSMMPQFAARHRLWIEQGGVYALAHLRGGGEWGEKWHLEGNLTKKQNVFDDFAACAKALVEMKYTTKERLAIMGGSNGGLLMGATITQNPDLCAAVVSFVGMYDMIRFETHDNGAFNVTEFGSVSDPEQFKALLAYSPYQNVKDGVAYPPTLMLTGANDPRVDPMNSRKMAARLQCANPDGMYLLRTSSTTGHGGSTPLSARIEQYVDVFAFLFDRLGMTYRPELAAP